MQSSYCKISIGYFLFLLIVLGVFGYTPTNDGEGYIEFAKECIAFGQPYPCTPTIVGKPFIWNIGQINLVALSLSLFQSVFPILLLMCFLKALTAYCIARLSELLFNKSVGTIAIILYILYPNNWGQSTTILSEIPSVALTLSALLLVLQQRQGIYLFIAGLLLGLANWFRPIGLVFIGSLFLFYLLFERKALLYKLGMTLLGYAMFILTVGTMCYLRTGYFLYQSDTLWFNMAEATYEKSVEPHYNAEMYPKGTARYIENREQKTAIECSQIWKERSLEWLKDNKLHYIQKVPGRLAYMYVNDMDNLPAFGTDKSKSENNYITLPYRSLYKAWHTLSPLQWLAVFNLIYYIGLLLGFCLALFQLCRKRAYRSLFLPAFITIGGSLALVLAIHGETRFKAAFMPFIFIMAARAIYPLIYKKRTL